MEDWNDTRLMGFFIKTTEYLQSVKQYNFFYNKIIKTVGKSGIKIPQCDKQFNEIIRGEFQ